MMDDDSDYYEIDLDQDWMSDETDQDEHHHGWYAIAIPNNSMQYCGACMGMSLLLDLDSKLIMLSMRMTTLTSVGFIK